MTLTLRRRKPFRPGRYVLRVRVTAPSGSTGSATAPVRIR
jgi:hypothetical protein